MLVDCKGNALEPGKKILVQLASTLNELEIVDIKSGGVVVRQDPKTGAALVTPAEIICKFILQALPGQPAAGVWVLAEPPLNS